MNINYTLEKHLKFLADANKEFELLYSIWGLNKKNLTQGLNTIATSFPHYSRHDISHSMALINNIQCLLGEERIKRLGATDTFLLLMAGLTHDAGMILTYRLVEEQWDSPDFKELLVNLKEKADRVVSDAASLILSQKGTSHGLNSFKWAVEIKNAVVIITAEIFRNKHARLGFLNLTSNDEFKKLAENFYSSQLPDRFWELLARIAYLHGENFDKVISDLYQQANGLNGDYIHPRFIACMIRLGDLLDFDNNRFNPYSIATIKEMPNISVQHQQKHAAVKHMLISPSSIEAELNCTDENVYRLSKSWFDWIEAEVNNQSREWTHIAPEDLGGLPPVIRKGSIRILYNGIQTKPELLNLRFSMSQQKIFSILRGGGIYKEPGFVFIREIVQNAFDASKIQMWQDIKDGIYDFCLEKMYNEIKFPDDIPPQIYNQYPIILKVCWKDAGKSILHFECSDKGTGISESTLLRMTKFVGESHNEDKRYKEFYNDMPYWLRPTAAFGVGLQSIFFVSQTFEVETSFKGETTKRIVFRSAADNQYSSIVEENIDKTRGTTIKVDIRKDKFAELFGTTFSWTILDNVDVFKNDGDNIYLAKIHDFVLRTFAVVENLNFKYLTYNSERDFANNEDSLAKAYTVKTNNQHYKCTYLFDNDILVFNIYENEFGSTLRLWFRTDMRCYSLNKRILVRDIIVANENFSYRTTEHIGFEWNLNNQETDRIVDISRDNLTFAGKEWAATTFLKKILPNILNLIKEPFEKVIKENMPNEKMKTQYLNYCLTSYSHHIMSFDNETLNKIILPQHIASKNKSTICAAEFFNADEVYVINGFKTNGENCILPEIQQEIEDNCKHDLYGKIVLWNDSYLYSALQSNFRCTMVLKYEQGCHIYKLNKIVKIDSIQLVENNSTNYLSCLEKDSLHHCSRNTIYALKEYSTIAVKLDYVSGFERFPDYGNCCIFSPFKTKKQISSLLDAVKGYSDSDIQSYIRENLSQYITSSMIEFVKSSNINKDITSEDISTTYSKLIYDFIKLKQTTSNA